jgi:hypothetical protein
MKSQKKQKNLRPLLVMPECMIVGSEFAPEQSEALV